MRIDQPAPRCDQGPHGQGEVGVRLTEIPSIQSHHHGHGYSGGSEPPSEHDPCPLGPGCGIPAGRSGVTPTFRRHALCSGSSWPILVGRSAGWIVGREEICTAIGFCHVLEETAVHSQADAKSSYGVQETATWTELGFARHFANKASDARCDAQLQQQDSAVRCHHCAIVVLHCGPYREEDGLDLLPGLKILGRTLPELVAKCHAGPPSSQAGISARQCSPKEMT